MALASLVNVLGFLNASSLGGSLFALSVFFFSAIFIGFSFFVNGGKKKHRERDE
ncbi:hypothetical protein [Mucilaginibacter sp.]|uniref:hypothetical protein n=1 Tax=Mucilaginibacter sp. TaxID=1882438 RepID=UPI0028489306|nr:hypothetical protein [Mucilaginibacter sp.]MDR3695646.1 hypothetical protein [Mucilaginibacter sp.]